MNTGVSLAQQETLLTQINERVNNTKQFVQPITDEIEEIASLIAQKEEEKVKKNSDLEKEQKKKFFWNVHLKLELTKNINAITKKMEDKIKETSEPTKKTFEDQINSIEKDYIKKRQQFITEEKTKSESATKNRRKILQLIWDKRHAVIEGRKNILSTRSQLIQKDETTLSALKVTLSTVDNRDVKLVLTQIEAIAAELVKKRDSYKIEELIPHDNVHNEQTKAMEIHREKAKEAKLHAIMHQKIIKNGILLDKNQA